MNNSELALLIGRLEGEMHAVKKSVDEVKKNVNSLVEANMLASGGRKMLYKVGAVCSTVGAGLMTAITWVFDHLK